MKKLSALLLIAALILSVSPAFALDVEDNGTKYGSAKTLAFGDGLTVTKSGGVHTISTNGSEAGSFTNITATGTVTFKSTLVANGRPSASTQVASSSTNLAPSSLPYAVLLKNIGGVGSPDGSGVGTELPNGVDGQMLTILISSCAGSNAGTWVVTPNRSTGFSKITFGAQGQTATLLYVNDTVGWIISGTGTTASSASPTITLHNFVA